MSTFPMNATILDRSSRWGFWYHRERTQAEVITHRILGGWFALRSAQRRFGLPETSLDDYKADYFPACRRFKKLPEAQRIPKALETVHTARLGL